VTLGEREVSSIENGMSSSDAAIHEAERAGFDLSLIDCTLALTNEQRLLQHDSALEFVLALKAAGAAHDARTAPSPPTAD